jgi:hypothetical protein
MAKGILAQDHLKLKSSCFVGYPVVISPAYNILLVYIYIIGWQNLPLSFLSYGMGTRVVGKAK